FFTATDTTDAHTFSLHDALPISVVSLSGFRQGKWGKIPILFGLALHQLNDHRKQTIAGLNSYSGTSNIANHNIDTGSRRPKIHRDRKSTRLNSSHEWISYAVFCL